MQVIAYKHNIYEIQSQRRRILDLFIKHRKTITINVALVSAILITGCLGSSMVSPSASMGSIFDPPPVYKNGLGAVNGYVVGSPEFPILGTIMVASEQSGQFRTVSVGLEPDGKYVFQDLNPGNYIIISYFPDGKYKVINNIQVEPNSVQTLIFKY